MSKDSILETAKKRFSKSVDAEKQNRNDYVDDWRFARLGEQWPEQLKRERANEGRPCLTINKLPSFIRQVVNDARQNTPQIKVQPIDGSGDPEVADIYSGMIRAIEIDSNADAAYDTALDCAVTGGFGYFRIDIEYSRRDSFDLDIRVKRIVNPLTVYGDPDTVEVDASDWRYAFVTEMIPKDEFLRKYPKATQTDWDTCLSGDDAGLWIENDNIRVAEYWTRNEDTVSLVLLSNGSVVEEKHYLENKDLFDVSGIDAVESRESKSFKVKHYVMTGAEVLEDEEWPGSFIPICPVYGDEIIVEGKRTLCSLIRHAKSAQQMFNYWRSAATELVALAPKTPFIGPEGAFDTDQDKWKTANTKSHPYITYSGQIPPQRQPFAGPPAGALQEAMNASEDIKSILGLFDASLGAKSNETSGRAILARQREGDVSTFHFIDNLARAIRYAGLVMVDLIPNVYSRQRMIRIIGPDDSTKKVEINGGVYDLNVGKYDVTVKSGPSFTTRREEASYQMIEMVKVYPQSAPLIGDIIAKNLDWPGADEIAKRLKAALPPGIIPDEENGEEVPPQIRMQMMQHEQTIQQMQQVIQQGTEKLQELEANRANEAKKLEIDLFNAQTNRMKAMADIQSEGNNVDIARINAEKDMAIATNQGQTDKFEVIIDKMSQFMSQPQQIPEIPQPVVNVVVERGGAVKKEIAITAPSGQVYTGTVTEDSDDVTTGI